MAPRFSFCPNDAAVAFSPQARSLRAVGSGAGERYAVEMWSSPRIRRDILIVAIAALAAGCPPPTSVACMDDLDCPEGQTCEVRTCTSSSDVSPELDAGGRSGVDAGQRIIGAEAGVDAGEPTDAGKPTTDAGNTGLDAGHDAGEGAHRDAGGPADSGVRIDGGRASDGGARDAAMPDVEPIPCGNGLVGLDEACDDGNAQSGDGCSSECAVEQGWGCGCAGDVFGLDAPADAPSTLAQATGGGGTFSVDCPTGMVATGLIAEMVRMPDWGNLRLVDGVGLTCSALSGGAFYDAVREDTAVVDIQNPTTDSDNEVHEVIGRACQDGEVLVGIEGYWRNNDWGISDLSIVCAEMIQSQPLASDAQSVFIDFVMNSAGAGYNFEQTRCSAGDAIVGLSSVGYGLVLDGFRGSCAGFQSDCTGTLSSCDNLQ